MIPVEKENSNPVPKLNVELLLGLRSHPTIRPREGTAAGDANGCHSTE
jgi:hypothetical protein